VQEAAVGVGGVGDRLGVGRLVLAARLDVRPRLLAAGSGRDGQLGDPLLVAALAFGRLGFQLSLGLLQPGQPAAGVGQLGRELVLAGGPLLAVLGLVGLGRLPQDLLDLGLDLVEGAVGLVGGVGGHLGAVQRDDPQTDQLSGGAQPQRGDQQLGQGGLVADAEAGDGDVVGGVWLPESTRKARSSWQRRWICREERTPTA
jgi:hypothetical protein